MRIEPDSKFRGLPCSYVGTGCAYEDLYHRPFMEPMLENLKDDGWSTLENTNKYVRSLLPVRKKMYYKRSERFPLRAFLSHNTEKCLICVYGHFIYVNGQDYWSYFDNDDDSVVCIWYLKS